MMVFDFRRCVLFAAASLVAIQWFASRGALNLSLVASTTDILLGHQPMREQKVVTAEKFKKQPQIIDVMINRSRRTQTSPEEAVAIEVPFRTIYAALVFMLAVFTAGYITSHLSMPDLVGHIIVGVLLGPPLANYVPFPAAFVMFGYIGIILLMVDAGINMDIAQLRLTGWRSVVMAHVGAFLSLAIGMVVAYLSKSVKIQGAVCLGAVLAPTSFGVSSNALISEKMINTPTGQIIVATAVIDDLIALVILSVVQQWVTGGSETSIIQFFIPIISSVLFLVIGGYIAIYHVPKLLTKFVISRFPERWQKRVAFVLLVILTMAYMPLMDVCKTNFLTGAFLSGLSFNQIPCVDQSFKKNTKNIFEWLLRIFFSASIGFEVPLKLYGDPLVIAWGFAFYIAVLGKIPTGFFVPKSKAPKAYPFKRYWRDFIIVGVAMTCRGELSFFIATYAVASGLVTEQMYASVVWAAFLSSVTSPIILRALIRYYNQLAKGYIESPTTLVEGEDNKMPMYWVIETRTAVLSGFYDHLSLTIQDLGLAVIDERSWSPKSLEDIVVTKIYVEDSENLIRIPSDASHVLQLSKTCHEPDAGRTDHRPNELAILEETMSDSESHASFSANNSDKFQLSKTVDETGHKAILDTCFDAEAGIIEHRRQEIVSALFKAVETMGDKNASIQVNPWIRAVVVRVGETDHISFRKSLRDEAAKELTEEL